MFLLSNLWSDIIKFYCIIDMLVISWKIWSIDFFCIFFLFIIFIRILCFLQNNDESSLNHCFFIDVSSFTTSIHDNVLNMRCVFSYICNCLLRSCMNVFNFCTFFVMNASWFSIFFSDVTILAFAYSSSSLRLVSFQSSLAQSWETHI